MPANGGTRPVAATLAGDPPVAIPRFRCGCGLEGCVDTVGGARGMERLHLHLSGQRLDSVAIVEAWQAGDAGGGAHHRVLCRSRRLAAGAGGQRRRRRHRAGGRRAGALGAAASQQLDREVRKRILRHTDRPLVVPGRLDIEPGLVGAAILGASA